MGAQGSNKHVCHLKKGNVPISDAKRAERKSECTKNRDKSRAIMRRIKNIAVLTRGTQHRPNPHTTHWGSEGGRLEEDGGQRNKTFVAHRQLINPTRARRKGNVITIHIHRYTIIIQQLHTRPSNDKNNEHRTNPYKNATAPGVPR